MYMKLYVYIITHTLVYIKPHHGLPVSKSIESAPAANIHPAPPGAPDNPASMAVAFSAGSERKSRPPGLANKI